MDRRILRRLVTMVALAAAFVVSLLAPRIALAANAVTMASGETRETRETQKTQTDLSDACSIGEIGNDDLADAAAIRVAAMCSESGASVVAPGRVLPVVDARLDAAPGGGVDASAPAIGPSPKDMPIGPPAFALADHGVLGDGLAVPPAVFELAPPFVVIAGEARAGVRHAIDHPPR